MFFGALTADKGTEGDVAIHALIALAIDAEGIELVFLHLLLNEFLSVVSSRV